MLQYFIKFFSEKKDQFYNILLTFFIEINVNVTMSY